LPAPHQCHDNRLSAPSSRSCSLYVCGGSVDANPGALKLNAVAYAGWLVATTNNPRQQHRQWLVCSFSSLRKARLANRSHGVRLQTRARSAFLGTALFSLAKWPKSPDRRSKGVLNSTIKSIRRSLLRALGETSENGVQRVRKKLILEGLEPCGVLASRRGWTEPS